MFSKPGESLSSLELYWSPGKALLGNMARDAFLTVKRWKAQCKAGAPRTAFYTLMPAPSLLMETKQQWHVICEKPFAAVSYNAGLWTFTMATQMDL